MKTITGLLLLLFINTSCVSVGSDLIPKGEYEKTLKWGGTASVIYKVESGWNLDELEAREIDSALVERTGEIFRTVLKDYFDEVHLVNANFTDWPKHQKADYKINISFILQYDRDFLNSVNLALSAYTLGIIPYTRRYKKTMRVETYKEDQLLYATTKVEKLRMWGSSLFVFFHDSDGFGTQYLKNVLRAAMNESGEKVIKNPNATIKQTQLSAPGKPPRFFLFKLGPRTAITKRQAVVFAGYHNKSHAPLRVEAVLIRGEDEITRVITSNGILSYESLALTL